MEKQTDTSVPIAMFSSHWDLRETKKSSKIYSKSSTSLLQTPASITVWIFILGPSDKYAIAQHASAKTSESLWISKRAKVGKQGET